MPLWDKVREELDRAGRVAQEALDEGRIRLEAFRARQLADKAAERLGYAVHRARSTGRPLADDPEVERLATTLQGHDAEADRLERQLAEITRRAPRADGGATSGSETQPRTAGAESPGAASAAAGGSHGDPATGSSAAGGGATAAGEPHVGASPTEPTTPTERAEFNREHL